MFLAQEFLQSMDILSVHEERIIQNDIDFSGDTLLYFNQSLPILVSVRRVQDDRVASCLDLRS